MPLPQAYCPATVTEGEICIVQKLHGRGQWGDFYILDKVGLICTFYSLAIYQDFLTFFHWDFF